MTDLVPFREGDKFSDEDGTGEDRLPPLRLLDRQVALGGVPR